MEALNLDVLFSSPWAVLFTGAGAKAMTPVTSRKILKTFIIIFIN
jgi:hypothetical protein